MVYRGGTVQPRTSSRSLRCGRAVQLDLELHRGHGLPVHRGNPLPMLAVGTGLGARASPCTHWVCTSSGALKPGLASREEGWGQDLGRERAVRLNDPGGSLPTGDTLKGKEDPSLGPWRQIRAGWLLGGPSASVCCSTRGRGDGAASPSAHLTPSSSLLPSNSAAPTSSSSSQCC